MRCDTSMSCWSYVPLPPPINKRFNLFLVLLFFSHESAQCSILVQTVLFALSLLAWQIRIMFPNEPSLWKFKEDKQSSTLTAKFFLAAAAVCSTPSLILTTRPSPRQTEIWTNKPIDRRPSLSSLNNHRTRVEHAERNPNGTTAWINLWLGRYCSVFERHNHKLRPAGLRRVLRTCVTNQVLL